ncbi:MAG TPA: RNA pseudouridine synthase [Azospirillaceae bacterium]|nr:RNA pseudouridine synthase [Azospirillaceae bacterium]
MTDGPAPLAPPPAPALTPEALRARVLHMDEDVVVIDKPTGLPVHKGTKVQDHLEMFLPALMDGQPEPPRLAHRLDKATSGCLALGRHPAASSALGKHFMAGRVEKLYWAVVRDGPAADTGRIDAPLRKVQGPTGALVVAHPDGKPATTEWRVLGRGGGLAWLALEPRTGRMHQLRAHLALAGFPILGDPIYGPERPAPCPLHLHARRIALPPVRHNGPPITAEAPLPPHMATTLAAAGLPLDAAVR